MMSRPCLFHRAVVCGSRLSLRSAGTTAECGRKPTMKMRSFQVCQCGAPLQMNEAETPKPQGTQVLLKMLAAGVCHSDLHIWDGYYEIGGGKKLMPAARGSRLPPTIGPETAVAVV